MCGARVSEFEPIQAALKFSERVDWVWVDSFFAKFSNEVGLAESLTRVSNSVWFHLNYKIVK